MKTLNIALLTFTLAATAGSAALALDGPRNSVATSTAYNDSYQGQAAATDNNVFAQQSEAALSLNTRGEAASQHH